MNDEKDARRDERPENRDGKDGSPGSPRDDKEESPDEVLRADSCTFTVKKKPACLVEYAVTAFSPLVRSARKTAVRSVAKEVTLPGFRKGKAPSKLVVKRFSARVNERHRLEIAQTAFEACVKVTKQVLDPGTKLYFDVKKCSPEGAELLLRFETRPEVPSVNVEGTELSFTPHPPVDDKAVEAGMERVRRWNADWETIPDHSPEKDEYVVVTIDMIESDPPESIAKEVRLHFHRDKMARWLYDLTENMKAGDTEETLSVPDASAPEEKREHFSPKKVRVTLHAVQKMLLPDLDDAFAKIAGADTLDQLRKSVKATLENEKALYDHRAKRNKLIDYLLTAYPFELPNGYVRNAVDSHMRHILSNPEAVKEFKAKKPEEQQAFLREVYRQCAHILRLIHLTIGVARQHGVTVSEEEVGDLVVRLDKEDPRHRSFPEREKRDGARNRLIEDKALHLLSSQIRWREEEAKEASQG